MNYKNLILILLATSPAMAALNLNFSLMPNQQNINPVPYRDGIPMALIKPVPPAKIKILNSPSAIIVKTNLPDVPAANTGTSLENKISLPQAVVEKVASVNGFIKRTYPSPALLIIPKNIKTLPADKAKVIYNVNADNHVPAVKSLEVLPSLNLKQEQVSISELLNITNDEYKMIHALLVYEYQKKMDSAFSLFADLQTSQQFKDQAQYYYAELALFFGLNSEFKTKMTQVMKNSSETSLKKQAVESLVQNAGAIDSNDVPGLETEITKWQVKTNSDAFLLKKAKYHASQGDLASAEESLNQIGPNSKLIVESKILQSTVDYRLGDLNAAIKHLESAVPKLASDRTDKLRNLTYLTLGRLYFQKGLYKQSYAQYLLIDKGSGFWLQSTTEQALTQIMAGDYIGAAGNMFSLHTEYFKKAYAPESYIIRAIGYLNLCQFGDSVSVVAELQKRYTPYIDKIQNFETNNKNSADYYNLVRELFNKNDQAEVNGVAKAFIIELARHPSFVSIQKKINSLEDELAQFNTVSNGLTGKANSIRQSITQTKNMITDLKNKKMNDLQIEQLQRKELVLETDLLIAQTGREKIEKMKAQASERIASEKTKLKQLAGEALQKRYILSRKELVDVLDQKDVLAYEIYSGAGEHLRYQMAGGETKERAPATALTPEEKQSYKWKFRGEVWEDEIGHYRSSLTNVCPKEIAKIAGDK